MKLKETERIAICRILLDVADELGSCISMAERRHYCSLKKKAGLTDTDFEEVRQVSVLSSLVVLKGLHYNIKMLLALTICDIYNEHTVVSLNNRIAFETLMNAIDWPISYSEILSIDKVE